MKKGKPTRFLFDIGSSEVVINKKHMKEFHFLKKSKPAKLIAKASDFMTHGQASISLALDENDSR